MLKQDLAPASFLKQPSPCRSRPSTPPRSHTPVRREEERDGGYTPPGRLKISEAWDIGGGFERVESQAQQQQPHTPINVHNHVQVTSQCTKDQEVNETIRQEVEKKIEAVEGVLSKKIQSALGELETVMSTVQGIKSRTVSEAKMAECEKEDVFLLMNKVKSRLNSSMDDLSHRLETLEREKEEARRAGQRKDDMLFKALEQISTMESNMTLWRLKAPAPAPAVDLAVGLPHVLERLEAIEKKQQQQPDMSKAMLDLMKQQQQQTPSPSPDMSKAVCDLTARINKLDREVAMNTLEESPVVTQILTRLASLEKVGKDKAERDRASAIEMTQLLNNLEVRLEAMERSQQPKTPSSTTMLGIPLHGLATPFEELEKKWRGAVTPKASKSPANKQPVDASSEISQLKERLKALEKEKESSVVPAEVNAAVERLQMQIDVLYRQSPKASGRTEAAPVQELSEFVKRLEAVEAKSAGQEEVAELHTKVSHVSTRLDSLENKDVEGTQIVLFSKMFERLGTLEKQLASKGLSSKASSSAATDAYENNETPGLPKARHVDVMPAPIQTAERVRNDGDVRKSPKSSTPKGSNTTTPKNSTQANSLLNKSPKNLMQNNIEVYMEVPYSDHSFINGFTKKGDTQKGQDTAIHKEVREVREYISKLQFSKKGDQSSEEEMRALMLRLEEVESKAQEWEEQKSARSENPVDNVAKRVHGLEVMLNTLLKGEAQERKSPR